MHAAAGPSRSRFCRYVIPSRSKRQVFCQLVALARGKGRNPNAPVGLAFLSPSAQINLFGRSEAVLPVGKNIWRILSLPLCLSQLYGPFLHPFLWLRKILLTSHRGSMFLLPLPSRLLCRNFFLGVSGHSPAIFRKSLGKEISRLPGRKLGNTGSRWSCSWHSSYWAGWRKSLMVNWLSLNKQELDPSNPWVTWTTD